MSRQIQRAVRVNGQKLLHRSLRASTQCKVFHRHSHSLSRAQASTSVPVLSGVKPFYRSFSSGSTDFLLADIGEGITECEVMQWFVKPGDTICQFDKVCEVQSDKATVEITSRYDGVIQELCYEVGAMAIVGKPLLKMNGGDASAAAAPEAAASPEPAAPAAASPAAASTGNAGSSTGSSGKVLCSPAVRRIAAENDVDLSNVAATGPKGRISKEDILKFVAGDPTAVRGAAAAEPVVPTSTSSSTSSAAAGRSSVAEDQTVPITGLSRIMVKTMEAANAVPQFGYSDDLIMDNLHKLRQEAKPLAEAHGVKLSYLPFIIKAVSNALKTFPQLNAHVTCPECSQITYKGQHNIGIAMDTPRGLLVPNVKDVQNLNILEIARELSRLQELGSQAKLGAADLTGGTFTLSNIGTIGGTYAKPIVVVPEVMIGAIGRIQVLPRFDAEMNVKPSHVMGISWSADHRVVDGATCARFSNLFKSYLENPVAMVLELR